MSINKLTFIKQTQCAKRPIKGEKQQRAKALYICECGKMIEAIMDNVKRGNTKPCGCIGIYKCFTHKLSRTKLYTIWGTIGGGL